MTAAIQFLFSALSHGFMWFSEVYTAAGVMDIFTGLILISLVMYRLVARVLGSAGSDRARRRFGKDNSDG